jgi:hypothetical protein
MESGPAARHDAYNVNAGGGQAGVWMSGMGFSSDGNRLFVVTVCKGAVSDFQLCPNTPPGRGLILMYYRVTAKVIRTMASLLPAVVGYRHWTKPS